MLIPKVSVQLNDRLSLFSKIPFGVAAISWDRIRIHRPDLPQEKQTINNTSFEVGLSRLQLNRGFERRYLADLIILTFKIPSDPMLLIHRIRRYKRVLLWE
jgi:hypothetical protein